MAYLFAVVEFVFLSGALVARDNIRFCETLVQCFVYQMYMR